MLLTVGRRFNASDLGQIPDNVHVEPWIDESEPFDEADLVVCHGGSGTAFGALAAGVPVVVIPVFADQFENGRRIAESGAGLIVETERGEHGESRRVIDETEAPSITKAIGDLLGSASYRRQARRIAAEIVGALTVDEALARLFNGMPATELTTACRAAKGDPGISVQVQTRWDRRFEP